MERLPWLRAGEGEFVAYPEGEGTEPVARVWFDGNAREGAKWLWRVTWPKWFSADGRVGDKQEAADAATVAWWNLKQTPVPRDMDAEIAAIMAVVETEALRADLLSDEYPFLSKLMWALRDKYIGTTLNPPPPPERVRNVMSDLSNEFFRRRTSGKL